MTKESVIAVMKSGTWKKQCKKVFEKPVQKQIVKKQTVQKTTVQKPTFQKPRPKSPIDTKGKKPMVSPIRILKRGESLKSEEKPKSTFEVGESSKSRKTSKIYPKTKIFDNQSWVAKSKPSVEVKKMENALKNETKVLKDDVVEFESELDKFLAEFPPINNKVKSVVKDDVPNGLPRSILSKWIMDSGASRHMTGTLALLYDVKSINGSYVGFAGNQDGRIVGQGTLTNGVISFEKVNYIVELENNLLSISQICDKSFSVHFTKNECVILKPGFKIPDEMVLLRAPREDDRYILDMSVATPTTHQKQCFVSKTKAMEKETIMWHRKMGHIHIRKMNFLVHNDLVEGVNLKNFHLSDDCVACKKGKQTRKSHLPKILISIRLPLERLHMDLFGPVNVKSISGDLYCLVVTDDFTRFSWVVCLERKDQTFESLMVLFKKMETVYKLPI
ncbi:putative nucleotidyltransferase, Ribonuclease H [Helianthus annuus]|nr:putative nucleotidyltransferase, Ribonuclease H [Helianthus annuus]